MRSVYARLCAVAAAVLVLLAASMLTGMASSASATLDLAAELNAAPQARATGAAALALTAPSALAAEVAEPAVATPAPTPEPTPEPTPAPPVLAPPGDAVARLVIPRLGVNNYIERRGVAGGFLESPYDGVYAVAWYHEYATPGRGGNSVFSAHETWNRSRGPFYLMHQAQAGDHITVQMASGAEYTYVVFSNKRHPADVNMGPIIWPEVPPGEEWATFMTCGGRFVATYGNGLGEYLDRDVVIAKRILS